MKQTNRTKQTIRDLRYEVSRLKKLLRRTVVSLRKYEDLELRIHFMSSGEMNTISSEYVEREMRK